MKPTISSKKAAEYFNVNESTVKRWADRGALKCYRTVGGHRKFLLEDLINYAKQNNFVTSDFISAGKNDEYKKEIVSRNYKAIIKKLRKGLLEGNTAETYRLFYSLYINNLSIEEIFDKIIKETMIIIGNEWAANTLNIENEHIATNTLIASLYQFERIIVKKSGNNKTALCTGLSNEYHEIGLLCVKINLEAEGWKVIYPGINLPYSSVSELITKTKPGLICISSTFVKDKKNYLKSINDLKELCKKTSSQLVFGGDNNLNKINGDIRFNSIAELNRIIKT